MNNPKLLKSLALGGYKSFGNIQRFPSFSKINLLIGQNNSGKSNVLKFIHSVLPKLLTNKSYELNFLERHQPKATNFSYGFCLNLNNQVDIENFINTKFSDNLSSNSIQSLTNFFKRKSQLDNEDCLWFEYGENNLFLKNNWEEALSIIDDVSLKNIWAKSTNQQGGSRIQHWQPELLRKLEYKNAFYEVVFIPAIRNVRVQIDSGEQFDGQGAIETLARLERPDVVRQKDKIKFENINNFLRSVTENQTATIEIPYDRDTILVQMNDRTLPLDSLGTGIQEVIILAVAATSLDNTVICMEEPELHLNPILQKRLIRYLQEKTTNQYFITTHSASLMDTTEAEIYQVNLIDNESIINRVSSDKHKSEVCENLGYHPSDLMQTNCVIWVEGPSDRIYLKKWINHSDPSLIEGIHFSIMFYGGKLASHISGDDIDDLIDDFISLRRLSRRAVIVIDSDRSEKKSRLNKTKSRLISEFNSGNGYAWVSAGREIENYIDSDSIREAITAVYPSASINNELTKYDNCLKVLTKDNKEEQASKTKVATWITENKEVNLDTLDLKEKIENLIHFIKQSNP